MHVFVTTLHVVVCILLIVVVLLQRGKGAELGAVFGGGASSTVFGGRGAGNFLTRLTTAAAIVFMCTSMVLAIMGHESVADSLFEEEAAAEAGEAGGGLTEIPGTGGGIDVAPLEGDAPAAEAPLDAPDEIPGLQPLDEVAPEAAEALEDEPAPEGERAP